jgi:hypothetical protein
MSSNITLKRAELFRLIWTEPMTKVSAQFGISDVALAKICKKMDIPRPKRGYWARRKYGYAVAISTLPPLKGKGVKEIQIREKAETGHESVTVQDSLSIYEGLPENKISVGLNLVNPHPLVKSAQELLKNSKIDEYGRVITKRLACLNVRVSQRNVRRALLIIDALIKALEKRDFTVELKQPGYDGYYRTCVMILEEEVEFGIYEFARKIEHKMTPSEQKDQERYPSLYSPRPFDYTPSGKLSLLINSYARCPCKKILNDRDGKPIEESLNSFVACLIIFAETKRAERLEDERKERERETARRLWEEQERKRQDLEKRIQELHLEVSKWIKSRHLKEYIDTVRKRAVEKYGGIHPDTTLHDWLTWATEQAELLDPLEKRTQQLT